MQLDNYFWSFEKAIPSNVCDNILKQGKLQKENLATVDGTDISNAEDVDKLKVKRNSKVVWLNDTWIYRELHNWLNLANRSANWNFQWDSSESCQFTKYSGDEKHHYDWHTDASSKLNQQGLTRKLSMSLALVDGDEYEGGDFEVSVLTPEKNNIHKVKALNKKGSITVFPSFVWHRVTPVTSGTE